ncbi:hypothetical protein E2C01_101782 [Portunus trituberculatus]|uniref:Uncharacterized protein n=1 Tax=Portunus trituberculatus TaxID=210409 RepID=A0A5B7KMR6_PORTR|nr:hypothetical protein [Portunus trituberculatus]
MYAFQRAPRNASEKERHDPKATGRREEGMGGNREGETLIPSQYNYNPGLLCLKYCGVIYNSLLFLSFPFFPSSSSSSSSLCSIFCYVLTTARGITGMNLSTGVIS